MTTLPALLSWIIGVPLSIWWPRPAGKDATQLRMYRLIRRAATCVLIGYLLMVLPDLRNGGEEFWTLVLAVLGLGAMVLTPLSVCAVAVDNQRPWLAVCGSVVAVLVAAGLAWLGLVIVVVALTHPEDIPLWQAVPMMLATLLCVAATVFSLEIYAAAR